MAIQLDQLLFEIQGLNPKAQLILGSGFVREEWKSLCFQKGYSIRGDAILSARAWLETLVPESKDRLLTPSARVELLRREFRKPELKSALTLLNQLSKRPGFFEKLDHSLQSGRLSLAHLQEAEVISAILNDKTGKVSKREEYFLLNRYWNRLLEVMDLWDEARLIESALQKIDQGLVQINRVIYRVHHSIEKPKWEWFWSEIEKRMEVQRLDTSELFRSISKGIHLKKAHFLEDAAHFLFDQLENDFEKQIVVIQDRPEIRRTLVRVASQRGVPLQDSRDPTLVATSESVKQALLDLELVSRGFPRATALEWIRSFLPNSGELRKRIIESALVLGLDSYRNVPDVHREFIELQKRYRSRMDLAQLKIEVFKSIQIHRLPLWVARVMERLFDEWESSLEQIGISGLKRPLRVWFEDIRKKILQVNPVIDPIRNRRGLKLFRIDQSPGILLDRDELKVNFFGIGEDYFDPNDSRSDWFSLRDQEILAAEFGWISATKSQSQNFKSFELWNFNSQSTFWTYHYDEAGAETGTLDLIWTDSEILSNEELGGHPRLLQSWKNLRSTPEIENPLSFSSLVPTSEDAWSFSFVQDYGKCPFIAFAQHLLKLQDEREVDVEPSSDRFGILLHAALEEWVRNQGSIQDAIDSAWKRTPLLGWEKNERWTQATRVRLHRMLESFSKDDLEYRERSGATVSHTEEELRFSLAGLPMKGRVDRIDQHDDGLIVMDYKSGGKFCDGRKTLETGKDLQLGLYSLAIRERFQQEVISAQYLSVDESQVSRNRGYLFGKWNQSKKTDAVENPITLARSNSLSLFLEDPSTIWNQLKTKAEEIASAIQKGVFRPNPADPLDCAQCRFQGVCGVSRN